MKKFLLGLVMLLFCQLLVAGEQSGTITQIRVSSTSFGFNPSHFLLSGTYNNKPSCSTVGYWALDTDTPAGQSMLSVLLSAQATGKTVHVWGANTCDLRSDMETLHQIGLD